MMRSQRNFFTLLWVVLFFFSSNSAAQDVKPDSLISLKGTWTGWAYKSEGNLVKAIALFQWRIHDTDFLNNTIELTEFRQHIDGSEITNPKRAIYNAKFDGKVLWLQLPEIAGQQNNLSLKLDSMDGFLTLMSHPLPLQRNDNNRLLSLIKFDSDTSANLKNSPTVEVIIDPIISSPK